MHTVEVGDGVFLIDLWEGGKPGRTGAYVVRGRQWALIETGASLSMPYLLEGLAELGVGPEQLAHIIVTHAHLDHAGGVGQMMAWAGNAMLHCHPRARPHLINPARLVEGAGAVYQERLASLFGPILPVPAPRVVAHEDGEGLDLGGREIVFYHTLGHAKHHVCCWDSATGGLFSGDMVGVRYVPTYTGWDFEYGLPTTSPIDFDPRAARASLDRIAALGPSVIWHTHFGPSPTLEALAFTRHGLDGFEQLMQQWTGRTPLETASRAMAAYIAQDMADGGQTPPSLDPLALDIRLNSQGILVYLARQEG